jgi:hypothetical protein
MPSPPKDSLFLQEPKTLSRAFNQAAQPSARTSRLMKGTATLMPPMPDPFQAKPRTPPGKPRGPGR